MRFREYKLDKVLPWIVTIGGLVGLIASIVLINEYVSILKNPHYVPICNLNPIFSCSTVTTSDQAHAFGLPNEYLGLAGYGALSAIGIAMLAGAQFKRWFWRLVNAGLLFAVGFITWLQFETLFRIGALCLFCMVVWTATIPTFWYVTLYNFDHGNLPLPKKAKGFNAFVRRHHGDILLVWFLIIIAVILHRFWYYWKTLI